MNLPREFGMILAVPAVDLFYLMVYANAVLFLLLYFNPPICLVYVDWSFCRPRKRNR